VSQSTASVTANASAANADNRVAVPVTGAKLWPRTGSSC
jgi:hypothetical protein